MTVQYRIYKSPDDIPLSGQSWDDIVARSNTGGIFLQRDWILGWWRYFGSDFRFYFLTAEENSSVEAFAPLMIDRSHTLRFIGDTISDYLGFAAPPGRTDLILGFFRHLNLNRRDWRVMHLRNIPAGTDSDAAIGMAGLEKGLHVWKNYSVNAPYLKISGNSEGVATLLNKYSLRRAERKLERQGPLEFRVFENSEAAAPHWSQFSSQHVARCNAQGRSSSLSNTRYLNLLQSVFDSESLHARPHFSAILMSGRPIAYHFGFVSQNRLLWYKPSFDTMVTRGSPGVVLIMSLIRLAQKEEFSELDFTIGDEAFKNRFCDRQRLVNTYRVHKSRIRMATETGYWRARAALKRLIR